MLELASAQRGLELGQVARNHARIKPELRTADHGVLRTEIASQSKQRLPKRVARVLDVAVGPEVEQELIPTNSALTRGRKDREECQRAALSGSRLCRYVRATRWSG